MKIPYQPPINATIIACLFLTFMFLAPAHAQFFRHGEHHFPELHPDSVVRLNHNISQMEYEPGELLVRFQDELELSVSKHNGIAQTGISAVDQLLQTHSVTEVNKLIPGAQRLTEKEWLTAPNGTQFERPSLHNIYLLRVEDEGYQLFDLIQALNEEPSVVYAEPNYIYHLVDYSIDSPVLSAEDLQQMRTNSKSIPKEGIEPDDPMFDQQWWIGAIGADLAWEQSTGDDDQVIAILDTGVDWQHPDLQNKIWENPGETENGQDSDGNGFVDDIRGWDFINNNNNPMDDNSHGTHVAGIAAAEADNGIGIAGVSWGARIMPVKVLQSSGAGTASVITQGINYAAENGATVINMSLGSYALSLAMQDALANAYATSVLVAAAGNDGTCIGPGIFCAPMFPAAFSFVLGVEASNSSGLRTLFSNYDQDGPVYSAYPALYNYELLAPGAQLLSTIPGGSYQVYSGTSMAAPIISGSAAIYRSVYPDKSQEMMWADMIHSSDGVFNLPQSIIGFTESMLNIVSHLLVDTLDGDGDGQPDAGETIELFITVRNTGAQANNVMVGIELGEFEDPSVVQIITEEASVGSISTYASRTNASPLVFKIEDDVADGRDIVFNLKVWHEDDQEVVYQPFVINVENGIELAGVLNEDLTLYPDNHYIITGNLAVAEDVTLTIKPGTKLRLAEKKSIAVAGTLISIGKPDSLIWITKRNLSNNWSQINIGSQGVIEMDYTVVEYGGNRDVQYRVVNAHSNSNGFIRNSIFQHHYGVIEIRSLPFYLNVLQNNHLVNEWITINDNMGIGLLWQTTNFSNNNIVNNRSTYSYNPTNAYVVRANQMNNDCEGNSIFNNGFYGQRNIYAGYSGSTFSIISLAPNYHGSIDEEKIKSGILDFDNSGVYFYVDISDKLQKPPTENHGIVWKVLVNGTDAQDEYVEPVGVGPHKFEVYFNRPMDIEYQPNLTFGVRYPYTQQAVADSAFWSADSTVYTAWKTVQLFTGDGINRIRVSGARDHEGFEIPIEDMRFEFLIDAAGAASTNFMATPGMGRIDLTWDEPDELDDFLGFNMYRFEHVTDTTFTDPILLNTQLILEPEHTDFEVLPGDKYYYYYKILRTNMAETDSSRVVMGIPDTAAPGDANGDYNVDVMDIVAIVAYMLNQNPQPFIFEAADVNQDGVINVMDIVGVVDLIMNAKTEFFPNPSMHPDPAFIHFKDDNVKIESSGQLTAIEFHLHTAFPDQVQLTSALPGHELAWRKTEYGVHGFIFNMQNKSIPEGIIDIIRIQHQNPDLMWGEIFGASPDGQIVEILTEPVGITERDYLTDEFQFDIFPNPARDILNIEYVLPIAANVEVVFHDMFGRRISSVNYPSQRSGLNTHLISTVSLGLPEGIVFCQVIVRGHGGGYLQKTQKILLLK